MSKTLPESRNRRIPSSLDMLSPFHSAPPASAGPPELRCDECMQVGSACKCDPEGERRPAKGLAGFLRQPNDAVTRTVEDTLVSGSHAIVDLPWSVLPC